MNNISHNSNHLEVGWRTLDFCVEWPEECDGLEECPTVGDERIETEF